VPLLVIGKYANSWAFKHANRLPVEDGQSKSVDDFHVI
jgi:hypothetical protein